MTPTTPIQLLRKEEALAFLEEGKRISHRTFLAGEYIEKANEYYYRDERGKLIRIELFWKYRREKWYMADWYLFQEPVKTEA